jgi:hypothetical protein
VDCHTGVWHHVPLIPAHAPGRGDDHDVENCGACGTSYHQEFLLLRMPHPGIQDEQGPVLWPRDDTECYDACSDVGVPHTMGAPPLVQWACRRRWERPLLFPG